MPLVWRPAVVGLGAFAVGCLLYAYGPSWLFSGFLGGSIVAVMVAIVRGDAQ